MSVLIWILTFFLVIISVLMVLVILAQRAKSDGGVGAALGGGMAEAAFGGGSSTILSKLTRYAAVAFFVLSFVLYLGHLYQKNQATDLDSLGLPASPGLMPEADSGTPVVPGIEDIISGALPADGTPAEVAPVTDEVAPQAAGETPPSPAPVEEAPAEATP